MKCGERRRVDKRKCLSCTEQWDFSTVRLPWLEGTSQVKSSAAVSRVKVSADGDGVVSHAGVGMLRELADLTGLSAQVTAALADTYRGPWIYDPGGRPLRPARQATSRLSLVSVLTPQRR